MRPFRELFCEFKRCSEKAYDKKAFWHCLHRGSYIFSAIVYAFHPEYFARDFTLLYKAGGATNHDEFYREIVSYQRQLRFAEGTLKSMWRLRISGNRLAKLGSKLFHAENRKQAEIRADSIPSSLEAGDRRPATSA